MSFDAARGDFPALKEWVYLDTAFVGLMPRPVREGYEEFLDRWMLWKKSEKSILGEWIDRTDVTRRLTADLIHAKSSEIAFTMATGSGLNIPVNGITWKKGDNAVFPDAEHNPLYTETMRRAGVKPRPLKTHGGVYTLDELEKMVDDKTRLVQVSHVGYRSGFRSDLKAVAEIAHRHGALLSVDATQTLGVLDLDVRKEDVDFLSCATYKYLLGPAGLAFLYIRDELQDQIPADRTGWKNAIWGDEAGESSGAGRYEYGTLNFQGIYAFERSLRYLRGFGAENIEKHVLGLADRIRDDLGALGGKPVAPQGNRTHVVCVYAKDGPELAAGLQKKNIKVTGRTALGGHLRITPHIYNNKQDAAALAEELRVLGFNG